MVTRTQAARRASPSYRDDVIRTIDRLGRPLLAAVRRRGLSSCIWSASSCAQSFWLERRRRFVTARRGASAARTRGFMIDFFEFLLPAASSIVAAWFGMTAYIDMVGAAVGRLTQVSAAEVIARSCMYATAGLLPIMFVDRRSVSHIEELH